MFWRSLGHSIVLLTHATLPLNWEQYSSFWKSVFQKGSRLKCSRYDILAETSLLRGQTTSRSPSSISNPGYLFPQMELFAPEERFQSYLEYSITKRRKPLNPQHSRKCERIRNVNFTKGTPLTMKRVNVPELDALFNSIAETFNKQQDHCLFLREAIETLRNSYDCSPISSLSVCMEKILKEHSAYNVQVCMEGYTFWLDVGVEEIPQKLKQTQQQVGKLNFATKVIVSTTIEKMIYSVHQCQDSLMEKVKDSSPEYLDWIRLESNLKENIEKINQAQKCSEEYREEADCVLLSMAKSANLTL